jgi:hypothetical protein
MAKLDYRTEERVLLDLRTRTLLGMILEQINVLRVKAGLAQITRAQAIARFKELMRA